MRLLAAYLMMLMGLTSCAHVSSPFSSTHSTAATSGYHSAIWQSNPATIWNSLQVTSSAKLLTLQQSTTDPTQLGWIQLALISKQKHTTSPQIADAVLRWRERYPSHPANSLLPSTSTLTTLQTTPLPKQIALLIPQSGSYASSGKAVREGFLNAYYGTKSSTQGVKFYDTNRSNNLAALYNQALAEGADFVIGPLLKENVDDLSRSDSFSAPVLALNYTNTGFGGLPDRFYEFGLLAEDEVNELAQHARKAGASRAIVIAPDNTWGRQLTASFSSRFRSQGGSIRETWYYSPQTDFAQAIPALLHINPIADKQLMKQDNTRQALERQRRQDFDVVFVFANPQQARVIVPLLRYYYVTDVPIYATSSVYSGSPNPGKDVDLNGVIVCDIPSMRQSSGNGEMPSGRLYAVGQDAYSLSQNLNRLIEISIFPVYGSTGALTYSSQQQIHRRIPCLAIQNGRL